MSTPWDEKGILKSDWICPNYTKLLCNHIPVWAFSATEEVMAFIYIPTTKWTDQQSIFRLCVLTKFQNGCLSGQNWWLQLWVYWPPIPADFLCESCGLVAREPSLTVCCGRHYCHTCISHLLRDSKPCPGCKAVPFSAFLVKNYQCKVLALRVHCTIKDCGRQWTGQLEQLDAHFDVETGDCMLTLSALRSAASRSRNVIWLLTWTFVIHKWLTVT